MNQSPTEIKPVGLDHSDPNLEVRRAFIEVINGLRLKLPNLSFGTDKTSAPHLQWMCSECLRQMKVWPIDKIGRWVGFIQGVMVCHGALDVEEERNRTRPLFNRAYNAMDLKF